MTDLLHSSKVFLAGSVWLTLVLLVGPAAGAELRVPATVEAGHELAIPTAGTGQGTFYLVGPDHVAKRSVNLGQDLQIQASDLQAAGRYQVVLCDSSCTSASFDVTAAPPAHLSFFLHPSRVPVSSRDSIDATALVFDPYFNLVLAPSVVEFESLAGSATNSSRPISTRNGVAWMRMDSTAHEGPVQVKAIVKDVVETRVVQQVASEACGLRVKGTLTGNVLSLETEPVRDCGGNTLPDGTVVSFTLVDHEGEVRLILRSKRESRGRALS